MGKAVQKKYADILHGSRPEPSYRHPRMTLSNRAKIFSPFSALRGYEEEIAAEIGNDGSGTLKKYVTESVNTYLAPIREKRRTLESDLDTIKDILHEGNKKANLIADATLNEVREAMNMLY